VALSLEAQIPRTALAQGDWQATLSFTLLQLTSALIPADVLLTHEK
jgi:hypothetical protein